MQINQITRFIHCLGATIGIVSGLLLASCNAKDDEKATSDYITTESVAVTNFYLSPDARVMSKLDSVYFSIDLEHGVIFNADSLPVGTNVTKLIPKIAYPNTVTSATIEMKGGTHREGTVKYSASSTDTIDFTGAVTLTLATANNAISKTYDIKVNVHKENPDTLYWDKVDTQSLPSRMARPKAQKSVVLNGGVYCMIEENDGSFTGAMSSDIFKAEWTKTALEGSLNPRLETLSTGGDGKLYVVDGERLMQSADGKEWTAVATGWERIIGPYDGTLLGAAGNTMLCYPEGAVGSMALPAGFPVSGYASPIEFTTRWSQSPTIVVFGGLTDNGELSGASWAFDGSRWSNIANSPLPALDGLAVTPYYSYLNSATNGHLKEFEVYLAFGGRDADGNLNNAVYVTYDNGINWRKAQDYMQLPEGMEAGYKVNALTVSTSKESNLEDRWKGKRRIPFTIDGNIVEWECPFIFLTGGYDNQYTLNDKIRGGVLQRLTFVPLF